MKYIYAVLLLMCFIATHAQEDPLYAQYLNNPLVINPAYTGLNKNFNGSISYRKQWAGFEGNPTTVNVSTHSSFLNNKMGLGLLFVQDKIGINKNTEAYATYAYHLGLGDKSFLSFGLQAGFINFKIRNGELNPFDPSDPAFVGDQNITEASVGAGLILHSERFFLGLSVPRMLKATAPYDISPEAAEALLYEQHFYGMLAYVFYLSERVRLKPSVLVKTVPGAPLSFDYNASVNLDEKYSLGLYTRNLNSWGIQTLIRFGGPYKLGYCFEVPTDNSVGTRFITHEFTFGFNMAIFGSHQTTVSNF